MDGEVFYSIGLDIGTTTTQCVLSSMRIVNAAPAFSVPRYQIVDKRVLHRAPRRLTPMLSADTIQIDIIRGWLDEAFRASGISPSQIKAGAVILTGETARKRNARAVAESLAGLAGEFVVATAGPILESVLAGRGSGADEISRQRGQRVLNLDIGGGTTNLCLFDGGDPVETGCLRIGGRLLRRDPSTGIVRLCAQPMIDVANDVGVSVAEGSVLPLPGLIRIIARSVELLEESAGLRPETPLYRSLLLEHGLPQTARADLFTFSGGVADCLYGSEPDPMFADDVGYLLGRSLAGSRFFTAGRVLRPAETTHATVIGAGIFSVSLSGSTTVVERAPLPIHNLAVGRVKLDSPPDIAHIRDRVAKLREMMDEPFAIGFTGWSNPRYDDIEAMAAQLAPLLPTDTVCPVIVIEHDIAKALGQALQRLRGGNPPLVCIDGIRLAIGDRIDIGVPMGGGSALPVVIKTLAL